MQLAERNTDSLGGQIAVVNKWSTLRGYTMMNRVTNEARFPVHSSSPSQHQIELWNAGIVIQNYKQTEGRFH